MAVCRSLGSTISSLTMASPTIPSDGVLGRSMPLLYFGMIPIKLVARSTDYDQQAGRPSSSVSESKKVGGRQPSLNIMLDMHDCCRRLCTTDGAKGEYNPTKNQRLATLLSRSSGPSQDRLSGKLDSLCPPSCQLRLLRIQQS